MTVAIDKNTGEIVHGHALRAMDDKIIERASYICPYDKCGYPATPCSYKVTNVKKAYFRYDNHSPDCESPANNHSNTNKPGTERFSFYINELKLPTVTVQHPKVCSDKQPYRTTTHHNEPTTVATLTGRPFNRSSIMQNINTGTSFMDLYDLINGPMKKIILFL